MGGGGRGARPRRAIFFSSHAKNAAKEPSAPVPASARRHAALVAISAPWPLQRHAAGFLFLVAILKTRNKRIFNEPPGRRACALFGVRDRAAPTAAGGASWAGAFLGERRAGRSPGSRGRSSGSRGRSRTAAWAGAAVSGCSASSRRPGTRSLSGHPCPCQAQGTRGEEPRAPRPSPAAKAKAGAPARALPALAGARPQSPGTARRGSAGAAARGLPSCSSHRHQPLLGAETLIKR